MPYVPGFTNDIFISFSHVDDLDGWVGNFENLLRNRLLQIGVPVTIWRDNKLRGTDVFSDEIFAQLRQSALLISIVSPSGIKSRWCEDERQAFERFAALNGGLRFGNHLRAIKVVKTPLDRDEHRALFGVTGFEFYEREEPQSEFFHEFHQSSAEFQKLRDKLALDIKRVLHAFCEHLQTAPQKDTVYVASSTPDLKRSRDVIVQQLEDWGYAVVPHDSEPPRRLESLQAVAKQELDASIFSVHLVSDEPQPISEGEQDAMTAQYELAQELRKDRIIWVEPGRQLYSTFKDALTHGLQKGMEILKERSLEDLKDIIEERLNRLRREPVPSPKSETKVEVYLICDRTDYPSADSDAGRRALKIKEYLDENGLVVMPPPYDEMDWSTLEEEHRAQLQLSNAVLLYWGGASENWFRKTRRIIVEEKNRRNRTSSADPLTEAFYFSSPPMQKSLYRLADFVVEQYETFDPDALRPLVDQLLANEEG